MHDLGLGGEAVGLAGHAVIEADADADEQVALGGAHIGPVGTVHADHAQGERIGSGKSTQSHEGHGHRNLGATRQAGQIFRAVGENHAATGKDDRPLGRLDQLHHLVKLLGIGLIGRVVGLEPYLLVRFEGGDGLLDILGDIHQNRPRTTGTGNVKGFLENPGQLLHRRDEIIVFGAGPGDPDDVHFLEGVVADQVRRDLTADDHQGNRVHVGRGDARDGIGGPGARRDDADATLPLTRA